MLPTTAQFVHNYELKQPTKNWLNRLRNRINSKLFAYFRERNPLVDFPIGNYQLKLPFSHALPFIFRLYPLYSTNLVRIATQVHEKYPDLNFIDIGANIGDTVALLRTAATFPILCIEGDDYFFSVLQANSSQFPTVHLAKKYVGESSQLVSAVAISGSGTAHLTQLNGSDSNGIQLEKLSTILTDYPTFHNAKMLKVDTDGFDNKVLRGSIDFLKAARPVIFFEYDPHLLAQQQEDGVSIFNMLADIGYAKMLVYDNNGELIMSVNLSDKRLIEELHGFYSGRRGSRYCDICVFHSEDESLFDSIRKSELKFFEQVRSVSLNNN